MLVQKSKVCKANILFQLREPESGTHLESSMLISMVGRSSIRRAKECFECNRRILDNRAMNYFRMGRLLILLQLYVCSRRDGAACNLLIASGIGAGVLYTCLK